MFVVHIVCVCVCRKEKVGIYIYILIDQRKYIRKNEVMDINKYVWIKWFLIKVYSFFYRWNLNFLWFLKSCDSNIDAAQTHQVIYLMNWYRNVCILVISTWRVHKYVRWIVAQEYQWSNSNNTISFWVECNFFSLLFTRSYNGL